MVEEKSESSEKTPYRIPYHYTHDVWYMEDERYHRCSSCNEADLTDAGRRKLLRKCRGSLEA